MLSPTDDDPKAPTPGQLEAALKAKKGKFCSRCGRSGIRLEADHIIPRSWGGGDSKSNKRYLCVACHDYRHARDSVLNEIDKFETNPYRSAQLTMWFFRLGVLEFYNTPEQIAQRGTFSSYGNLPETMYSRWYTQIKVERKHLKPEVTLPAFVDGKGQQNL